MMMKKRKISMVGQGISPHQLSSRPPVRGQWRDWWCQKSSEHPVTFMSGWVCDNITTGGRASFTIGRGIQMKCHLLSNEGVEVNVVKTVPTTTEGLCRVSWGTRRARTHRNACHGTTKTCKGKERVKKKEYETTANRMKPRVTFL